jgi:hypothetical protein
MTSTNYENPLRKFAFFFVVLYLLGLNTFSALFSGINYDPSETLILRIIGFSVSDFRFQLPGGYNHANLQSL